MDDHLFDTTSMGLDGVWYYLSESAGSKRHVQLKFSKKPITLGGSPGNCDLPRLPRVSRPHLHKFENFNQGLNSTFEKK
jgi:hypothetical protein